MENQFSLFKVVLTTKNYFVLKDFYADVLELKLVVTDNANGIAEFEAGGGFLRIEKGTKDSGGHHFFSLKTENWKTAKAFFTAKNVQASPAKIKEGKFFFELTDPDGNRIQIIEG